MVACAGMPRTVSFVNGYIRRAVDAHLDELFPHLPAILLDGPKGVGKTSTARQRAETIWELDRDEQLALVAADPYVIGRSPRPVLVDEWQRHPPVYDTVRRLVDDDYSGRQFLLTGSAPLASTHSGAGRITTLRMRPLTLPERLDLTPTVSLRALLEGERSVSGECPLTLEDYVGEIVAGGFPGIRHLRGHTLNQQLDSYIDHIVSHDLPEAGLTVRRPAIIRRWLKAYAAATATTATWETIRDAASPGVGNKPAKTTTIPYVELLTRLRILDPLDGWAPTNNHIATATLAPKHHLCDPALAARLVRASATQLLRNADQPGGLIPRDGTFLGGLFESLAALSVQTFALNADARVYHLRTYGGRQEVDFIVETGDGVIGLEAKLGNTVKDSDVRHLRWLREKLGDNCIDVAVLNTGSYAFRRQDGVAVIPLGLFGP